MNKPPGARRVAGSIGRGFLSVFEQYGAALAIWSSAQRGRTGPTLLHRVARMLATSPKPMTRTEITRRLRHEVSRQSHRAVMNDLRIILNAHQVFHEMTRGRWQLGKEGANMGGLALPPRPPAHATDVVFNVKQGTQAGPPAAYIPTFAELMLNRYIPASRDRNGPTSSSGRPGVANLRRQLDGPDDGGQDASEH